MSGMQKTLRGRGLGGGTRGGHRVGQVHLERPVSHLSGDGWQRGTKEEPPVLQEVETEVCPLGWRRAGCWELRLSHGLRREREMKNRQQEV